MSMSNAQRLPSSSAAVSGGSSTKPGPVRVALSPRVTVAQAERLARWPGMALVIEDGRPWLEVQEVGA